jgi:hypothetical protein
MKEFTIPTNKDSFEEYLKDPFIKAEFLENGLRQFIAKAIKDAANAQNYNVKNLVKDAKIDKTQLELLLHYKIAGYLTLKTVMRAFAVLKLDYCFTVIHEYLWDTKKRKGQ